MYAGVCGSHIRCQASDGVAAIGGGEVTPVDVDRVLEGARAIPIDSDRQILHVLPHEFIVDNQDRDDEPRGFRGGKGFRGEGIIKNNIINWLNEKDLRNMILAVNYASKKHGGDGALYIFLKKS